MAEETRSAASGDSNRAAMSMLVLLIFNQAEVIKIISFRRLWVRDRPEIGRAESLGIILARFF